MQGIAAKCILNLCFFPFANVKGEGNFGEAIFAGFFKLNFILKTESKNGYDLVGFSAIGMKQF